MKKIYESAEMEIICLKNIDTTTASEETQTEEMDILNALNDGNIISGYPE